jgi:TPR repeat protein
MRAGIGILNRVLYLFIGLVFPIITFGSESMNINAKPEQFRVESQGPINDDDSRMCPMNWDPLLDNSSSSAASRVRDAIEDGSEGIEQPALLADLRQAALAGDTQSENTLGWLFTTGNWVSQDREKALYWLERAAEKGHPATQVIASSLRFQFYQEADKASCERVEHLNKLEYWSRSTIRSQDPNSQYSLNAKFQLGRGLLAEDYDSTVAIRFLIDAADRGHEISAIALQAVYESSGELQKQGVEFDAEFLRLLQVYSIGSEDAAQSEAD